MKINIIKRLACLAPIMLLMFGTLSVSAEEVKIQENSLKIIGDYQDKVDISIEGGPIFDVYDIVPGDKWDCKLTFKNISNNNDSMEIYITDIQNDISDFLMFNTIEAKGYLNGDMIFDGKYNEIANKLKNFKFVNGDQLYFVFEFPLECKNEYQEKELDSTWIFNASYNPKEDVQTADYSNIGLYFSVMVISLLLILIIKKEQCNDKKHNIIH